MSRLTRYMKPLAFILTTGWAISVIAAPGNYPTFTDTKEAGADYAAQGEYVGKVGDGNDSRTFGIQVIALGEGKFRAVVHDGGLPGDGWQRGLPRFEVNGESRDGVPTFTNDEGMTGRIMDRLLIVTDPNGKKIATLEKTERKSPTLGAKPPKDAVILFDGKNVDAFSPGKLVEGGLLGIEAKSKQSFGNFSLHLEFRTPFMPTATGQARGNSGVYLHNTYEVQVLDSFGLEGKNNECGGIYGVQDPSVNMCLPPLSWQTYDIDFTAAKFDDQGNKIKNARVTVRHNGVVIYEDFELPRLTPGGAPKEGTAGPLKLQDHGNPVHFRNIWVVEKK